MFYFLAALTLAASITCAVGIYLRRKPLAEIWGLEQPLWGYTGSQYLELSGNLYVVLMLLLGIYTYIPVQMYIWLPFPLLLVANPFFVIAFYRHHKKRERSAYKRLYQIALLPTIAALAMMHGRYLVEGATFLSFTSLTGTALFTLFLSFMVLGPASTNKPCPAN